MLDQPFLTQGGYLPGTENDAALGAYYNGWSLGGVKVTPVAEVVNSFRSRDRGWAADPTDSGYERILLSPGIELDYKRIMVYFDVGFPVYHIPMVINWLPQRFTRSLSVICFKESIMNKIILLLFLFVWGCGNAWADTATIEDKGKELYLSYGCALVPWPEWGREWDKCAEI